MKLNREYSRAIERRLLAVYYRASVYDLNDGLTWYTRAHELAQFLADQYAITPAQSCGVIAALSPGNSWERNVEDAETLIRAWQAGLRGRKLPIVGTYGHRNAQKSIRILKGESPLLVLGGNKVRSFYHNILDPADRCYVTIDRHAKCAAYGLKSAENSIVRDSEYEYLAEHYRWASERVGGIDPCQFQAVVWVTWRRLGGVLEQQDLF